MGKNYNDGQIFIVIWKLTKAVVRSLALIGWGVFLSNALLWAYPGAFLGLGLFAETQRIASATNQLPASPLSPADLNAVLLAVATIVLAVVAFGISVCAFFGYSEIKRQVVNISKQGKAQSELDLIEFKQRLENKYLDFFNQVEIDLSRRFNSFAENVRQSQGLESGAEADSIAESYSRDDPPHV